MVGGLRFLRTLQKFWSLGSRMPWTSWWCKLCFWLFVRVGWTICLWLRWVWFPLPCFLWHLGNSIKITLFIRVLSKRIYRWYDLPFNIYKMWFRVWPVVGRAKSNRWFWREWFSMSILIKNTNGWCWGTWQKTMQNEWIIQW